MWMIAVSDRTPRYKEARIAIAGILHTVCFTMQIVQQIPTLLVVVYVCIDSGYAQTNNNCGPDKFRCHNGECISDELLCDGRADCRDSSDETATECKKSEILCPTYAFRCNYGGCINANSVCNGVQDCVDNSDETQPQCTRNNPKRRATRGCQPNQFTCDNGQCILTTDVCDGARNCADGSDEVASRCESLFCSPRAFRCNYGACIDGDLKCNGVADCADESDENHRDCTTRWPSRLPTPTTTRLPPGPKPITDIDVVTSTTPHVTPGTNACQAPPQPQNGQWKLPPSQCPRRQECSVPEGTILGLGSYLIYSCDSGYKIRGPTHVICSIEGRWLNIPVCTEIRCRALTTASIKADCTHDGEWVPCESPVRPRTIAKLDCQNSYQPETNLLSSQRKNVRCNEYGEWEPEPMRCEPVCGIPPPNIIPQIFGGTRPNVTEFPWHASMYRDEPDEPKKYFCGASVIKESILLTAAHCVYDESTRQLVNANEIYILVGNTFRDYDYPFHNPIIVKKNQVKHIYVATNYLGLVGNYLWDIAVLELVEPFVLSYLLVPACIDISNDRNVLESGSSGKVAGFGLTEFGEPSAVLQALTVPIISLSQCKSTSNSPDRERYITDDKICAGYTNGSSVCDGDSGGGLVSKFNGLWYLRGIVSVSLGSIQVGGTVRCNNQLYSLYTDVSRHIAWVENVITKIEHNQRDILCSSVSGTRCS